jgi:FKBP-type peptidyl-prolyl cis-trans isomerase SlyD
MTDSVVDGKHISLTYVIKDVSGETLEQSELPVTYIQGGHSELIGGMDDALRGKRAGDEVELNLTPAESGFGEFDPDLTFTDDLDNVPAEYQRIGAEVQMQSDAGDVRTFYVTRISDGQLTLDGNHPLAGKHLVVRVRIIEVRDPTAAEARQDAADSGTRLH